MKVRTATATGDATERVLAGAERLAAGAQQLDGELLVGAALGLGLFVVLYVLLRPLRSRPSRPGVAARLMLVFGIVAGIWLLTTWSNPALGLVLVLTPVVALLFVLGRNLGPWLTGLALVGSGRLRPGDFVAVGQAQGTLAGGDLLHARLVGPDGAEQLVPWTAFSARVTTRAADAPCLARVHVDFPEPPSLEERRQLEIRAALCPYRVWTRPVLVRPDPERKERLDVELWSWSEEGARSAEDFIRRALRRDGQPRGELTPPT